MQSRWLKPPPPPESPSNEPTRSGGIDIHGGDVRAGRDFVAGNVNVAGDSIAGQTVIVQQGFTAAQVQKLVLLVAGVVVATAALFFVIGALTAGPVLAAVSTPGQSSLEAAARMGNKIAQLEALPPGQGFQVWFSQEEVSSYFRFVVGPALNISDGRARFMDTPGQIALEGNFDDFGGLPMLAEIKVTTNEAPIELVSVWVKILPTGEGSSFGWIPVTFLARDLERRLNEVLFGQVYFTHVGMTGEDAPTAVPDALLLAGVAK